MTTRRTIVTGLGLAAVGTGTLVVAGPLDPPSGPIGATYRTLQEIEPRVPINDTTCPGDLDSVHRIVQRGSYYLTGNIVGVSGKHGIEIASADVTIDLNGFALVGAPGSLDAVSVASSSVVNLTVSNGAVRAWGGDGFDGASAVPSTVRLAHLTVRSCGGVGIAAGIATLVTGCEVSVNGGVGITTNISCTVSDCTVYDNGGTGIFANSGSTVHHCTSYGNGGTGIAVATGCTVEACSASGNGGSGFSMLSGSTIWGCSARASTLDGILVSSGCQVRDCTSTNSGSGGDGAGIHATGNTNRIERNLCTGADRGYDIDGTGSFIAGNSAGANTTNWTIAAGNVVGPIVASPLSAVINGDTGGSGTGSTNPWANFTH